MIFLTVGSQKFQFNRLLQEADELIEAGVINPKEIFAQAGYSSYQPRHYRYDNFLDSSQFNHYMNKSKIVVTHGGTGSIIDGVKRGKKVIGIPRSQKYGEHVDDHQYEIIGQFTRSNMIYGLSEVHELGHALEKVKTMNFRPYKSNTAHIIHLLEEFLV